MKHVILDNNWEYSTEPFPAYRCNLIFGRNKKDFAFLPVKGIQPQEDEQGKVVLPEDHFKIIKTRNKGTILVVPGEDTSDRVLLMAGVSDGFRGFSAIVEKHTTCLPLLKVCSAHNNCEGHTSVAAILAKNEQVVLSYTGRRVDRIVIYKWDGKELEIKEMERKEFEATLDIEGEEEGETL